MRAGCTTSTSYRKYTDVRLVFAPEADIAFFGGDPDNFEFPRYDLDITFFRVYENGKPARIEHYFTWSKAGVKEGEPVFVSGHPGSTGRMLTVAQMQFLRDVQYPWQLESYKRRIAALEGLQSPVGRERADCAGRYLRPRERPEGDRRLPGRPAGQEPHGQQGRPREEAAAVCRIELEERVRVRAIRGGQSKPP